MSEEGATCWDCWRPTGLFTNRRPWCPTSRFFLKYSMTRKPGLQWYEWNNANHDHKTRIININQMTAGWLIGFAWPKPQVEKAAVFDNAIHTDAELCRLPAIGLSFVQGMFGTPFTGRFGKWRQIDIMLTHVTFFRYGWCWLALRR